MRYLGALTILTFVVGSLRSQELNPEKFFDALEKRVVEAKSLIVHFQGHDIVITRVVPFQGVFYAAPDDKLRIDFYGLEANGPSWTCISDGKAVSFVDKRNRAAATLKPCPPGSGKLVRQLIPRVGVVWPMVRLAVRTPEAAVAETLMLSEFVFTKPLKIGDADSLGVRFKLKVDNRNRLAAVFFNPDTTTLLRTVYAPVEDFRADMPEGSQLSYSKFEFNGKVDPKVFEIASRPKAAEEKEETAAGLLAQAKKTLEEGNKALAAVRLRNIVSAYPSTKAALQARSLLQKIEKQK